LLSISSAEVRWAFFNQLDSIADRNSAHLRRNGVLTENKPAIRGAVEGPQCRQRLVTEQFLARKRIERRDRAARAGLHDAHLERSYAQPAPAILRPGSCTLDDDIGPEPAHLERMGQTRVEIVERCSGGQQQRVAVARAVVNNPKLILADEPTGNLDSSNGNEVMQLLTDLNEQGTTIIMVTHSEHDARYSHRIIRMLDGQTVLENIMV